MITDVHLQVEGMCSPLSLTKELTVHALSMLISIIKCYPHRKCELVLFPFLQMKILRPIFCLTGHKVKLVKRQHRKDSYPDLPLNQELCAHSYCSPLKLCKSDLSQNVRTGKEFPGQVWSFHLSVLEMGPDLPQLVWNRNGIRTLVS